MAYLYLLAKKDGSKFKIGRANEVWKRATQVSKIDEIDLDASYVVSGDSNINRLEKTLHYLFEFWADPEPEGQDGRTEWFRLDALEHALNVLDRVVGLRKHQKIVVRKGLKPTDSWVRHQESMERRLREYEKAVVSQRLKLIQMIRLLKRYGSDVIAYCRSGHTYSLAAPNYGENTRRLSSSFFSRFRVSLPNCGINLITSMSTDPEYLILDVYMAPDFMERDYLSPLEPQLSSLKSAFADLLADVKEADWVKERSEEQWVRLFEHTGGVLIGDGSFQREDSLPGPDRVFQHQVGSRETASNRRLSSCVSNQYAFSFESML